jgi:hypothetical protein
MSYLNINERSSHSMKNKVHAAGVGRLLLSAGRPLVLASSCLLLLAACSSSRHPLSDSSPTRPDAGVLPPDTSGGQWRWAPEDDGAAPSAVALALESLEGDTAWVKVAVRGVPALQGVALRLMHDPERVEVLESEQGAVWSTGTAPTVARFAPQEDGELWAGIGFRSAAGVDARQAVTVARFKLALSGPAELHLGFRPGRNLIIDPEGKPVPVTWLGGAFVRSR